MTGRPPSCSSTSRMICDPMALSRVRGEDRSGACFRLRARIEARPDQPHAVSGLGPPPYRAWPGTFPDPLW